MNSLRHRPIFSRSLAFLLTFLLMGFTTDKLIVDTSSKDQTIMIALLLDTSNSMDGLIDQAKSQLWKIVNEVAAAKSKDGGRPKIKIALYEYGNDGLPASEGHIRQVSALTEDLDVLSEKLFSLRTNGGNEFCGQVINAALNQLTWSATKDDLKMIFIAGNEDFMQGNVSYELACDAAKKKGIIVNSIYCGDFRDGISLGWKNASELTDGAFMSIEQDSKMAYVTTPYDNQITALNDKLNDTYVYYGSSGEERKEKQIMQDKNAASYGLANAAERIFCKSSDVYKNSSWDLVDAAKDNEKIIAQTKSEDLPAEMRNMNMEQRKKYIRQKSEERTKIQADIRSLNKKRQEYIYKTPQGSRAKMLDASMMKAIKEQGRAKNLKWEMESVQDTDSVQNQSINKSGASDIVFKSTDGGKTWQDISEGLPENLKEEGLAREDVFADDNGLHLRAGNKGIYHSIPASAPPFWKKENSLHWQGNIAPGRNGIFAYNYDGQFFQKMPATAVWSPVYANFYEKQVRSIFETAKGTSFICCDYGLYKSTDRGKTWKRVLATGGLKLVESNGVLMGTSQTGIIRSTDDGENWDEVLSEGGVGITVERIKGGFAAITFNGRLNTRKVHTSYDGGKTWQPIDAGLAASLNTASIIQVGENFFCGHSDGIYQSPDKGKTWKLILPSINNLVFNLFVSGNVIYAIPLSSGC